MEMTWNLIGKPLLESVVDRGQTLQFKVLIQKERFDPQTRTYSVVEAQVPVSAGGRQLDRTRGFLQRMSRMDSVPVCVIQVSPWSSGLVVSGSISLTWRRTDKQDSAPTQQQQPRQQNAPYQRQEAKASIGFNAKPQQSEQFVPSEDDQIPF
jgi:hypothetical protein